MSDPKENAPTPKENAYVLVEFVPGGGTGLQAAVTVYGPRDALDTLRAIAIKAIEETIGDELRAVSQADGDAED